VAAPFTGGASLIPSLAHAAGGGTVEGGEPTVVGEEGPELFVPSAPGTVIPNRRTFAHMGKISPPLIQQTWS
jgi:hypothetical protein